MYNTIGYSFCYTHYMSLFTFFTQKKDPKKEAGDTPPVIASDTATVRESDTDETTPSGDTTSTESGSSDGGGD